MRRMTVLPPPGFLIGCILSIIVRHMAIYC
jgi:hypothetical protein